MASPQKWCEKTSGHFRTARVPEDGVFLSKMVTIWTQVNAGRKEVRRGISPIILGLKTNCGSDLSLFWISYPEALLEYSRLAAT
jgi:hypothetical protein